MSDQLITRLMQLSKDTRTIQVHTIVVFPDRSYFQCGFEVVPEVLDSPEYLNIVCQDFANNLCKSILSTRGKK